MPAKDKVQKIFHLTPAQDKALKDAKVGNLSDYIRRLITSDLPNFPQDMPARGEYERKKK
jgi:hypothetical protein